MRRLLLFAVFLAIPASGQVNLEALRESIKGRENEPAGTVFKNVQVLKEVPAGRFLSIMQMGYSRSLGVRCDHCHTPGQWEDDSIDAKRIAREMSLMVRRINSELLPAIADLKDMKPTVNCTTCHRGEVKPALDMP